MKTDIIVTILRKKKLRNLVNKESHLMCEHPCGGS